MNNVVTRKRGFTNRNRFEPFFGTLLDDLFNEGTSVDHHLAKAFHRPKVNIWENDDAFVIELAAPGYDKSDFHIHLEEDELTISAEIESKETEDKKQFNRREFSKTTFKRSFNLPETVDGEKIKANFENGILELVLPKKEESKPKPPRAIEIG